MRVYFDLFSNDELISDSYVLNLEYNDVIMSVPSRMIIKGDENIDIGRGNEFGGGGEDEAVDSTAERVNEIIEDSIRILSIIQLRLEKESALNPVKILGVPLTMTMINTINTTLFSLFLAILNSRFNLFTTA